MSQMVGADVDELTSLSQSFERSSQSLRAIESRITSMVHSSPWAGPAAVRFVQEWDRYHRRNLAATAGRLHDASINLAAEADQQRATSGAGPSGGTNGVAAISDGARSGGARSDIRPDFLGDAALGIGIAGALEFAAQFGSLIRHFGNLKSIPWSKISISNLAKLLRNADHAIAELRPISKYTRFLGPAGVLLSGSALIDDLRSGDEGKAWRDGMDTVVSIVGTVPILALPAAAFSTGELIGDGIVRIPAVKQGIKAWDDAAFDQAMLNAGGDAHAVAERYSGLAGPMHFAQDTIAAGWNKIVGIF